MREEEKGREDRSLRLCMQPLAYGWPVRHQQSKVRVQGVRRRLAAGTLAQARCWIWEDARKYPLTSKSQTREMLTVGKCTYG